MSAVLRDSANYTTYLAGTLAKPYDLGGSGRVVPIPWEFTIISAYTTGDQYNLCVIPQAHKVVGISGACEALGASAAVGTNVVIGIVGTTGLFVAAWDTDLANSACTLAVAGQNYVLTTGPLLVQAVVTGTAVVGRKVKGCFFCVPGA